jgi:hypothetical protein
MLWEKKNGFCRRTGNLLDKVAAKLEDTQRIEQEVTSV